MNKFLRYSFVALLAMIGLNVMADTDVTFTLNDKDAITALGITLPEAGKGTKVESLSKDGVNIAVTTAAGMTDSRIYQGSGNAAGKYDFRIYKNGTMTFTAGDNYIKKIKFTGNNLDKLSASGYSSGEWNGSAESVLFTATATATIYTITVTYGAAAAVNVPEFSVLSGTYLEAQTVTMTCSTEGAKILYTIPDGSQDPVYIDDENYTGVFYDGTPLTIRATTTIKAMAIKDGKTSSIATATYTIIPTRGKGTAEDPFSVADALLYINNMENGATTADKYYVKGFVVGTPSIDKKPNSEEFYGNAKFYMGDTKNAESKIYAYQLKGLDNANIDKEDYIKDGDQIVTYSKLQKFVKNNEVTPELSSGYIYSIATAPTTYKITITNTEHGNITLDKTEAAEGEKVSVIGMSTDEGWEMNQPTITAENGAEVVIGGNDDEGHYFIMPASNVTIELNITKLYIITTVFDSDQGDVTGVSFDSEKSPIYKGAGENVQFTVTAKEGFKVESVTAADADNTPITVNVAEDKSYYFEMPAKDVTITAVFSVSVEDTWTVAGTQPLTYNTWDPTDTRADMTPNGNGPGVSTYERNDIVLEKGDHEFKVVKNHDPNYGEAYPAQNYVITVNETAQYHVKIFFNTTTKVVSHEIQKTGEAEGPVTHTWSVIGTLVGNWDVDTDMTKGEDGLYTAKFENIAKGTYQFKVRADHAWNISYPGSDYELKVEQDNSTVTVTFNESNGEVKATVNGESPVVTHTYSVIGTFKGDNWMIDYDMTKRYDGLYKVDIKDVDAGRYEFKVRADHDWNINYPTDNVVVSVDQNCSTVTISFDGDGETKAVNVTVTAPQTFSVIGDFKGDNWTIDYDMEKGNDGLYKVEIKDVDKGGYEFKVRIDHDWDINYPSDNATIEVDQNGSTVTVTFDLDIKEVKATVTAPTGISTAKVVDLNNAQRYNTAGQKVSKDYKGIVIVNGKKFVVK